MTEKVYSKEELEKIWKKTKPRGIVEERLRIDVLKSKVERIESYLDIIIRQIDLINFRLDKIEGLEEKAGELELIRIPEKKAIQKISEYVAKHPGCRTSDIIFDLQLDPNLVLKILKKLEKKGKVKGKDIG